MVSNEKMNIVIILLLIIIIIEQFEGHQLMLRIKTWDALVMKWEIK